MQSSENPTFDSKPFFRRRFRPAADRLARFGVRANQVTATTIVMSLAIGALVTLRPAAGWPLLLVPGALIVRLALNHIDGLLAEEHDQRTPLGAMLNELADVISDSALYLPLALVPGLPSGLIVLVVVLATLVEMTGVLAMRIGARRREDGPMGKKTRGLILGCVAAAIGLGAAPGPWLDVTLLAVVALLVVTLVKRLRGAVGEVAERCPPN